MYQKSWNTPNVSNLKSVHSQSRERNQFDPSQKSNTSTNMTYRKIFRKTQDIRRGRQNYCTIQVVVEGNNQVKIRRHCCSHHVLPPFSLHQSDCIQCQHSHWHMVWTRFCIVVHKFAQHQGTPNGTTRSSLCFTLMSATVLWICSAAEVIWRRKKRFKWQSIRDSAPTAERKYRKIPRIRPLHVQDHPPFFCHKISSKPFFTFSRKLFSHANLKFFWIKTQEITLKITFSKYFFQNNSNNSYSKSYKYILFR